MYFTQRPLVSLLALCVGTTLATGLRAEPGHVFEPVTPEQTAGVEAGLPSDTFAPAQARRVLVFYRTEGFVHKSIPVGILALQRLGEKTKAFTTVASEDMAMFNPEQLAGFDAVVFLNSTGLQFSDPVHRQALLDFVRRGKGVIGIHAASDNFPTWPEGQALIGGVFHGHPWNAKDVSAVKLDEPKHVLNLPFDGKGFWVREEIYQLKEPYSRANQRVLLSLDMSKPQNARPADKIKRTDNDFAISWIKPEGKGRVFYTSLGHNDDIFYVQPILRHILDGIRYALGDLAADDVPSAKAGAIAPALAPDDATTIQTVWVADKSKPAPKAKSKKNASAEAQSSAPVAANEPALPKVPVTEAKLSADLLNPASSLQTKYQALAELTLRGTAASIPAIAATAVSDEPGLAERSALVLAQLRLPEAEAALIKITEKRTAGTRAPFITALRAHRSEASFKRLATLAKDANADDAHAARAALATFGTKAALKVLFGLKDGPDTNRFALAAADAWLGRESSAAPLVVNAAENLLKKAASPSDRAEAVRLLAKALPPANSTRLVKLVSDPEPRVRQIAAAAVVRSRQAAPIAKLAATWATLSVDTQIVALAEVVDSTALPLARLSLTSTDNAVVNAGIAAVARSGNVDALLALLPRLGETGPLRDAAYLALSGAQTKELSARLTEAAAKPDSAPALRVALVSLLGDRQVNAALPLVVELTASPTAELRAASFKALGDLAQTVSLDDIIKLAGNAKKSADQREFRKALYTAAGFEADSAKAVVLLGNAIADPTNVNRAMFIGALTLVKGEQAEALLAKLLTAPAAADRKDVIRALSAARTDGSLKLLQKTAENGTAEDERILAIRGCIETIPTIESLGKSGQISAYRKLWPLAQRAEEKDAILAAVGQLKGKEAEEFIKEFTTANPPSV